MPVVVRGTCVVRLAANSRYYRAPIGLYRRATFRAWNQAQSATALRANSLVELYSEVDSFVVRTQTDYSNADPWAEPKTPAPPSLRRLRSLPWPDLGSL
jgi:hypothetical protein